MDEEKKGKEDGPEAVREERKKEKEDGPEAVSEERKEKKNEVEEVQREKEDESLWKLNFTGWQLQLAVLMVLIAKSKAHGGHDDPSDQANTEPLQLFMMLYTFLVILSTLLLRRILAWLFTPAIEDGDAAAGH